MQQRAVAADAIRAATEGARVIVVMMVPQMPQPPDVVFAPPAGGLDAAANAAPTDQPQAKPAPQASEKATSAMPTNKKYSWVWTLIPWVLVSLLCACGGLFMLIAPNIDATSGPVAILLGGGCLWLPAAVIAIGLVAFKLRGLWPKAAPPPPAPAKNGHGNNGK